MEELQPPIYFFGIRVGEPVTALTDLLVSAVCFYAFFKLGGKKKSVKKYFRYHFLFLGLATFWGGLVTHAMIYFLSQPWKVPGWIMSTWAVSLLALALVKHHYSLIGRFSKQLTALIIAELVMVMTVTIYSIEFRWAGFHSAFGLVFIVASLSFWSYFKFREEGSLMMIFGVAIFMLSGIVFTFQLKIHTWFNYVDLTHVLLAVAAFTIYKGVLKMDPPEINLP